MKKLHSILGRSLLSTTAVLSLFVLSPVAARAAGLTTLHLTAPTGGETLSGTTNITWTSDGDGAGDSVNVLYSDDGFASIRGEVDGVADNGASGSAVSFDTRAMPDTTSGQIRIVDSNDSSISDTSGPFTIGNSSNPPPPPPPTVFTIEASAGPNGSINPSGSVSVNEGSDQTFTITPDQHFHVGDVMVDGSSVGPVPSYTFSSVSSDHSISATFNIDTFSLHYSAGPHGSLRGATEQTVPFGGSGTRVKAVADTLYHFVNWSDGSRANPRTDTNVTSNISVVANFALLPSIVPLRPTVPVPLIIPARPIVPVSSIVPVRPIVSPLPLISLPRLSATSQTKVVTPTIPTVLRLLK